MKNQVENGAKLGRLPEGHLRHKGFSEWDSYSSRHDHDTILQVGEIEISVFVFTY